MKSEIMIEIFLKNGKSISAKCPVQFCGKLRSQDGSLYLDISYDNDLFDKMLSVVDEDDINYVQVNGKRIDFEKPYQAIATVE